MNDRLGWEPLERRVLGEGIASGVLIVAILAVFGGFHGVELAALTVVTAVSLLLDVHLPQGGSVPLGYAVLIALAYLLPGGDYLLVVLFSVLLALPVLNHRLGALGTGTTGLRWLLAALTAGVTAHLVAGLGLGGDHNTKILVCVVLGGVSFLTADLLTARFASVPGEERVNAGSAWPVYVTLLSAAALLALADRFEHGGSTGSPWLSAIAFCPLLITRFSFERYAQASSTYRQTIQALSIVPEVAGMSRPGHGERTAVYAATLADELGVVGEDRERVITAARLHRIGFICLDDEEEEAPESVDPRRVARSARRCCARPGSSDRSPTSSRRSSCTRPTGDARRGHRADRQPLRRPGGRGAGADEGRARDHLRDDDRPGGASGRERSEALARRAPRLGRRRHPCRLAHHRSGGFGGSDLALSAGLLRA